MNLNDSLIYFHPLYHFDAYGLGNPFVQEAIRLGAYDPAPCADCKGTGGRWLARIVGKLHPCIEPRWERCWACGGSGRHESAEVAAVYASDFGSAEDLAMARRLVPDLRLAREKYQPGLGTRKLR